MFSMRILHVKKLYLPALSIVAVILLLLALISISTYRNLDREKTMALKFLHNQGLALLHSLEAGARAWMLLPMWQEDSVNNLILESGKNEEIAYVYLVNKEGIIVHHSDPEQNGKVLNWNPNIQKEDQVLTQIRNDQTGQQVYELTKFFSPASGGKIKHDSQLMGVHGHIIKPHLHHGDIVVLGMKMTSFDEARRSDIQHALIMAAILLVLGSGALFFIFVIQNYYLVDRTLKQTQDYTRLVLASMANGLVSVDIQGKITSYNPLAVQLLGLEETDIHGADFSQIIDFQISGIDLTLQQCMPVLEKEIRFCKQDDTHTYLALSVTPILGEGNNCQGAVIIMRDLSEIKHLEEKVRRSEKLAAIGKLAAGVAHEIRNPLSSIRGFAQFLKQALVDRPEEKMYAETMVAEVDRINSVVTDLLTFARPMKAEFEATNVGELMEKTILLVSPDANGRNIEIHRDIASDLPAALLDSNQIKQALLNLLLNALEASEPGGQITAGAAFDKSSNFMQIWVADKGPGIPVDQQNRIYDPFFTTRKKGTGLGLAIVHKIVENHHGEILLESPPNGEKSGCRFKILVPVNPAPHRGQK